jgi:hypothetical protein
LRDANSNGYSSSDADTHSDTDDYTGSNADPRANNYSSGDADTYAGTHRYSGSHTYP